MDHDAIEASNLNRQQFAIDDIEKNKAACLKEKLTAINPDISCDAFEIKWKKGLSQDPLLSCDILIEAFDQAETKSDFIDHYSDRVKYIVSGNGMGGINGPRIFTRQQGNIFFVGDGTTTTDQNNPPMAPRVTACAAMMAETILNLILK
jgi:sulfur carrier protein ThiS adenylyltransferase